MGKARKKHGAAMVVVIITSVLFTMMAFSLILASSTLSSAATRKWIQLRMEQQALGVSKAFAQTLTSSNSNTLQTAMDGFLYSGSYVSYDLMSTEVEKQVALHPFPQTATNPSSLSNAYGQVTVRLKKVYQNPVWQLSDTIYTFAPTNTAALNAFLESITDEDYQLTAHITVISPEDEQAVGTAEVTFLRTVEYQASYYKNSVSTINRIYPNTVWEFFTDPQLTSGLVSFTASEIILAQCASSATKAFHYQVAEVRHEAE
jgi:hypothetical protein